MNDVFDFDNDSKLQASYYWKIHTLNSIKKYRKCCNAIKVNENSIFLKSMISTWFMCDLCTIYTNDSIKLVKI